MHDTRLDTHWAYSNAKLKNKGSSSVGLSAGECILVIKEDGKSWRDHQQWKASSWQAVDESRRTSCRGGKKNELMTCKGRADVQQLMCALGKLFIQLLNQSLHSKHDRPAHVHMSFRNTGQSGLKLAYYFFSLKKWRCQPAKTTLWAYKYLL